jgi:hypothetical protein
MVTHPIDIMPLGKLSLDRRLYAMGRTRKGLIIMSGGRQQAANGGGGGKKVVTKRKYTRRAQYTEIPANNVTLIARLLDGKNAHLVVILIIVLSVGYGIFTFGRDMQKDFMARIDKTNENIVSLTEAVRELGVSQQRKRLSAYQRDGQDSLN